MCAPHIKDTLACANHVFYTPTLSKPKYLRTLYLFSKSLTGVPRSPHLFKYLGSLAHKTLFSDQKIVSQSFRGIFIRSAIFVVVQNTQLYFVYHKQIPIFYFYFKHFKKLWLFLGKNQINSKDFDAILSYLIKLARRFIDTHQGC